MDSDLHLNLDIQKEHKSMTLETDFTTHSAINKFSNHEQVSVSLPSEVSWSQGPFESWILRLSDS